MSTKQYGFQEIKSSKLHSDGVKTSVPKNIRDHMDIEVGDELIWVVEDDVVHLYKKSEVMQR